MTDGDLISRTDLLKDIADLKKSPWFNDGKGIEDLFRHNSYVARKEAIEIIEDLCIRKLPSAEKTAKWKLIDAYRCLYDCSNCGQQTINKYPFCPWCGARMGVKE